MKDRSHCLLLDAGDFLFKLQSTPDSAQVAKARLLLDLYREMGYQALCVGTRDLANSPDFLAREASSRGLRLLSANLYRKGVRLFPPYHIFKIQGLRIGVLGLTSTGVPGLKDLEIRDPYKECLDALADLRGKVDVCILLSNLGYFADRSLAQKIRGIDIIIGSGYGSRLSRPLKVENTYILRGDVKGKTIGRAELLWNGTDRRFQLKNYIIRLDERFLPDESVRDRIQSIPGTL